MLPSIADLFQAKHVALRVNAHFDVARLAADLARMEGAWWQEHLGGYDDGNWQSISLHAPNGDRTCQSSRGGPFSATEALACCEYVPEVIEFFPGAKSRVRFLRLRAGGEIFAHSDPMHQIDPALVRIHVPVQTNPAVDFVVNGTRLAMRPGEAWCVDVRFKHSVRNAGEIDRVHLVVDVAAGRALRAMLASAESAGRGLLSWYFLKHALPARLLRRLKLGN